MRRIPFATLLIVGMAATVLAVFWGIALRDIVYDRERAERAGRLTTMALAQVAELHARTVFAEAENRLRLLRRHVGGADAAQRWERFEDEHVAVEGYDVAIGYYDASGELARWSGPVPKGRRSIAGFDLLRRHQDERSDALLVGKPFLDETSGRTVIPLSTRLEDERGGFAGVAMLELDSRAFHDFYASLELPPGTTLALVRSDGLMLARRDRHDSVVGQRFPHSKLWDELGQHRTGHYQAVSAVDQVERVYAFRADATFPIVVAVGIPADHIFGEVNHEARETVVNAAGFSLFMLLVSVLLLRETRRREDEIAARRTAEAALAASEQRLRDAIESIPDSFLLFGPDDRLVLCNERTREYYPRVADLVTPGARFDDLVAAAVRTGQVAEADADADAWVAGRLASAREVGRQIILHTAEGRVLRVADRRTSDGGFVSVRTDITDLKRREQELAAREAHFRSILETVADGIVTADEFGTIRTANAAAERLYGYGPGDLIGLPVTCLIPERYHADHKGWLRSHMAGGQPTVVGRGSEILAERRDGSLFPVEISVAGWSTQDGRFVTAVVRDVTERKRIEDQLIQARDEATRASAAKSQFLAMMSHELRTPLNAVIGFADTLEIGLFGPLNPKQHEYIGDIRASGEHLLSLINDILDLSKIEAGSFQLTPERLDVAALAESCQALVGGMAAKREVGLTVCLPDRPASLYADERAAKQILVNLMSNAVKFTNAGGRATLSFLPRPGGGMTVRVADTGVGMSPAGIAIALEPFGQIDSQLTRREQGTGLGLPLVKRMMDLHGGSMTIESEPGEGTTVTLEFPGRENSQAPG